MTIEFIPQEVDIVEIARTIVQIVFIILSIIMTVIVLMQEGKNNGLGALTGSSDTYWSKNKGRSMEGMLVKITRVLLALFLIISAVLTIRRFQQEYLRGCRFATAFYYYTNIVNNKYVKRCIFTTDVHFSVFHMGIE